MANESGSQSWGDYSRLVLKQLEGLSHDVSSVHVELQEIRKDILKLEMRESRVDELKVWKDKVDEVFSPSQMKELREKISAHDTFKTKAVTVFAVVQFIMAAALVIQKFFGG